MRFAAALALCAAGFAAAAAAQPEARIETNMGTIVVLLEDVKAPKTVANFIRYVKKGHYNNTSIYRIVPGYVMQTGSMGADGKWRQTGNPIPLETATGLSNKRGAIAMAREDKPASAEAEFFINLSDNNARALDPKPEDAPNTTGYAVFGMVTSGMDVVDAIVAVPLDGGKGFFPANYPKTPVIIKRITIGVAPPPAPPADPAAAPAAAPPVAPEAAAPAETAAPAQ